MSIYEGTIELIGEGTYNKKSTGSEWLKVTAFDIGNDSLRNVKIPSYINNYLNPGKHTKVLISKGLTGKVIEAVEVDGKKYKISIGTALMSLIGKSLLACILLMSAGFIFKEYKTLAILLCSGFVIYQIKKFIDYIRF